MIRRKKKGQMPSQMFMYILSMIIIGLMIYLSMKWMGSLFRTQEDISVAQIKIDMENAFEKIKYNYGSWKFEEFSVPSGINKVCFLDEGMGKSGQYRDKGLCNEGHDDYDPLICDAWEGGLQNVAFDPRIDVPVYISDVKVGGEGYLCQEVDSGKIKVKLTGLGNAVKVSS